MAVRPLHRPLDLRAAPLFDIDPELSELLDERQRAEARARAIVAVLDLPPGPWSPERLQTLGSHPFALMVVDGLLLREVLLAGSTATEMLGPCDIADITPSDDPLLPTDARWSVPHSARIALLDDRLLGIARSWPSVARVLLERSAHREVRLSTHRAIAQLPRVDQRLLAYFGHIAERFGRVAPAGVVIPLALTHETLGRLIGARRPTVSLALKELGADGLLERRGDGSWLLRYEAFERLGAESRIPRGWQPAEAREVADAELAGVAHLPRRATLAAADVAVLRERVAMLSDEHARRVSDFTNVLARARTIRAAVQARRDGLGGA